MGLQKLLNERERACRLVPELALQTLDEAESFLRERGLRLRAAQPLRGLSRGAVQAGLARLRALAADEMAVGVRARGPAGRARARDPPRQGVFPTPAAGGLADLFEAGVRAAVVAREDEARRWFSWPVSAELVDELVESSRLERPEPPWLSVPDAGGGRQ
jgi:hypothetical protein